MTEHELLALAAPYALDALDGEERAAFEAHLAQCERCRAEVTSFRDVAGRLALAVPTIEPAPGLRDRVTAEARRVRPLASRIPWLAAAGFVLAALLGGAWLRERVARQVLEARVAEQRELLATLLAPDVGVATLAATGKPPSARLFWNPQRQRVVMAVFDLPPAPAGRTYQLWAIATGKPPVSLGIFNTGADGRVTAAMDVPAGLAFTLTAVTEEPAGGSPQPTQNPFLVGSVQRTE
ncbi:MAG TPA: anti-sigma factor [Gemmatimonadales bacterium]|jgi:anti-sigma-K factor RskA|nr:anti-sigma factor [Gemmatimonadales bacterium]